MNRILKGGLIGIAVVAVGGFLFREPLREFLVEQITSDMFVAADADSFDPGIAIGQPLPALRARYDGRELTSIAEFMGSRGTVLVVNRSVDW